MVLTTDSIYIQTWMNELQWGEHGGQYVAMMALRSHGYEVWGEGYWEEFVWKVRPPGKEAWCIIDPDKKDPRPDG